MPGFEGALTVVKDPHAGDVGPEAAARYGVAYLPEDDRVEVDVEPDDKGHRWMADNLPAATGAKDFQWTGLNPLRYRLYFHPDTDVAVEES
jgi:hypothetical protein